MRFNITHTRAPMLAALFFVLTLVGCGGPLTVDYRPVKGPGPAALSVPARVFVKGFTDERGVGPRTAGSISAVVSDMSGKAIVLDTDLSTLVARAFAEELENAGYIVVSPEEGEGGADYVLEGAISEFNLDVASRDEITIDLRASLTEPGSSKAVWTGGGKLKDSRYAGVMGNSRASISDYITRSLSKVLRNMIVDASGAVAATGAARVVPYAPGTGTGAMAPEARPEVPAVQPQAVQATGRLLLKTTPERASVYLDDVYYGLTPLTLDIRPGIYGLRVSKRGYADVSEKVSIRARQVTEMELILGSD